MALKAANAVVPLVIAVDGRSGAGKTTLAVELAALLREHHRVSLFHLEDIYPGWDGLAAGMERYVDTVLSPLAAGEPARWRAWDWAGGAEGGRRSTEPADIVIMEGVGSACRAARKLLDVIIWVDAPEEVRRGSALQRDGDAYAPYWQRWADQESAWLSTDRPADAADILVEGHRGAGTPSQVRLALTGLPQCESLLSMERAQRRGLAVSAERVDAWPEGPSLFQSLYGTSEKAVWLDSSDAGDGRDLRSRFSIMADDGGRFGQSARHTAGNTLVTAGAVTSRIRGPFFRWLDSVWGRRAVRRPAGYACEFALGWLGYLGYELKRETGGNSLQTGGIPDAALIFAGRAVVLDHQERCCHLMCLADGNPDTELNEWLANARTAITDCVGTAMAAIPLAEPPAFTARDTRTAYLRKVRSAQAEIIEGNSYEVCLTTALTASVPGPLDPLNIHLLLREGSPAPFAHFLRFPGVAVISSSPERFLRLGTDGAMRAEPIKGTRRRSPDPATDAALRRELRESPKDRAENIMIVDLLRNDLSHLAVPGSVAVTRLCAVETYATVHQLVSTIDAVLRPGSSRAEAVAAAFPAGSMTGAPKISTMAILDRLEGVPRGVYAGGAGYFSLTGAADLAVVIRTLVIEHDDGGYRLTLGLGGAVTADSVPEEEWDEVRTKSLGVLSSLGAEFPAPEL